MPLRGAFNDVQCFYERWPPSPARAVPTATAYSIRPFHAHPTPHHQWVELGFGMLLYEAGFDEGPHEVAVEAVTGGAVVVFDVVGDVGDLIEGFGA